MVQDQVASVVGRFYAALRANDVDAWVNLFAADATARDPVGIPPHRGHEGLRDFLSGVLRACYELHQNWGAAL
jgi:ketosteroid isomerase-like protein